MLYIFIILKMEIPVLVRLLKSSIIRLSSSEMDQTFWGFARCVRFTVWGNLDKKGGSRFKTQLDQKPYQHLS